MASAATTTLPSRPRAFARRIALLAGALVLALVSSVVNPGAAHADATSSTSAQTLGAMFGQYGDTSGKWNGGDSTASVQLPDGRVAWLFSDTFLGPINPDGSRPTTNKTVHNSMVVQDGDHLTETRVGGTDTAPTSLAGGEVDSDPNEAGYWVADGVVEGQQLRVLYNRYRRTGTGGLDVALTGTALGTFQLPSLTLSSLTALPLSNKIAWGSSLTEDGGYTYIYGSEFADTMRFAHVARVPTGRLSGSWEFWTGSGWSTSESASARLISGVNTAYSVEKIGNQYVLLTTEGNLVFNPDVVAYTAAAPTGPFTGPTTLFTAPEPQPGEPIITYDARLHQHLAAPGKLLISYNVNSLENEDNFTDARLYRPRFVEVNWPLPVPDPALLPAVPSGFTGAADDQGVAHLSWQPSDGDRYWIYQRDVTAGQTHFARRPASTTQTSGDISQLTTGHTYQFEVTAGNAAGESVPTSPVSVTPHISPPAAPTGITATSLPDGQLGLSWNAVPQAWSYHVFRRDVTGGETDFVPGATVSTTTVNLNWLEQNHEYELYVTAEHGGGTSGSSAKVRVTVHYPVPPVPTGLIATANNDGTITLNWSAPGSNLWYWVYQRDVTAGETTLTKLPLPISNGSTMTAGYLSNDHVYEFVVSSTSRGGESPLTAPVRATAHYPPPAAPTNLTAVSGDGQVTLNWTAPGPDLWYWMYQRDVTAGETTFTKLPLPISSGSTMTAGLLANGHQYEFKVTSTSAGGESAASNTVQTTPQVPLPGQVTGATAVSNSDGTITVSWTATGPNVWYWLYQRDSTAGQAWQKLPLPISDGTSMVAKFLTDHHQYQFKVAATNAAGDGPTSAVVSATSVFQPPPVPRNLVGRAAGDGSIDLDWDAPAPDLYYWVYYRDVTDGQGFVRGMYPTDKTSASMAGLKNNHVYEFKINAENQGGEGPSSNTVSVTAKGGLPAAPTNLQAGPGDGKVTLTWTASSSSNVYYWIEYRPVGQSWTRLPDPLSTCCSFTMNLLNNGTAYEFRVRATNVSGDSAPTNVASARPMPPLPAAPTGLTAGPGDGKLTLNWTASSTSNVYYWIEYRPSGGTWQRLAYPLSTCCSFTMNLLNNGTTYEVRVRATNITGDSAASNTASARPMPPFPQAPSSLGASVQGENAVRLTWTASPTKNVYYWIEYRPSGGAWQRLAYPVPTCCSFTVNYLAPLRTYEFRVRATNVAGDSSPSNTASAYLPVTPPGAAAGVRAVPSTTEEAITVSWDAVSRATGYSVDGRPCGSSGSWTILGILISGTSYTVRYLGGCWDLRVVADRFGVEGPESSSGKAYVTADDYPYRNYITDWLDGWGFLTKECTSFVTYRIRRYHIADFNGFWHQPGIDHWWNAKDWDAAASRAGIRYDSTPKAGSIAQWEGGTYGHVAFVAGVGNGYIVIEEYNGAVGHRYSTRVVSTSDPSRYLHFEEW
jgi:surface antigen